MKATLYLIQVCVGGEWEFDEFSSTPLNLYKSERKMRDLRLQGRKVRLVEFSAIGKVVQA